MMKLFVVVLLATLAIAKASPPCLGCPSAVGDEKGTRDATNALKNSLAKLAAGDGPHYTLGEVHSATTQVIQGFLYKINADLVDEHKKTRTCDIDIIDFNDVTVTFHCPGEEPLTKKHSS